MWRSTFFFKQFFFVCSFALLFGARGEKGIIKKKLLLRVRWDILYVECCTAHKMNLSSVYGSESNNRDSLMTKLILWMIWTIVCCRSHAFNYDFIRTIYVLSLMNTADVIRSNVHFVRFGSCLFFSPFSFHFVRAFFLLRFIQWLCHFEYSSKFPFLYSPTHTQRDNGENDNTNKNFLSCRKNLTPLTPSKPTIIIINVSRQSVWLSLSKEMEFNSFHNKFRRTK